MIVQYLELYQTSVQGILTPLHLVGSPVKMEWLRLDSMLSSWLPTRRCRTAIDSTCNDAVDWLADALQQRLSSFSTDRQTA